MDPGLTVRPPAAGDLAAAGSLLSVELDAGEDAVRLVGVGDDDVLGDAEGAVRAERHAALLRPASGGGGAGHHAPVSRDT
ncbi:MAG: hypothetical protein JO100_09975 [Pseudonocardia sp.]|nr:hypothetical protein [Pseudonocardia sp.]